MAGGEVPMHLDGVTWSCTIAGVQLDNAGAYCADVERWARAVREDTAALPLS